MSVQLLSLRKLARITVAVTVAVVGCVALTPLLTRAAIVQDRLTSPVGGGYFVENVGQFDPQVRFRLLDGLGRAWLTDDGLWLSVLESAEGKHTSGDLLRGVHLKLTFEGANLSPSLEPSGRRGARVSYFLGSDPAGWHPNVPVWGQVRYVDLYPGVDLILGGEARDGALPWQLRVDHDADLDTVRLRVEGARAVEVRDGALHLTTTVGPVALPLPTVSGLGAEDLAHLVDAAGGPTVETLSPAAFAVTSPFVPSAQVSTQASASEADDLDYSTFLGGSSWDWGFDVALDDTGAAYVTGSTPSSDFPTTPGAFDTSLDSQDAFALKISPDGSSLAYATFLGGASFESGQAIALDGAQALIAGHTRSPDFPTTEGAYDRSCGSDGSCDTEWYDAFLVLLNADGTALQYSTFLGGQDEDRASGLAVEGGVAFLAGRTSSADFPTTDGAYDRSCGTDGSCNPVSSVPTEDAYLLKISPAGQGTGDLLYGTYLGGSSYDGAQDIAVSNGEAFVVGDTSSFNFPGGGYQGDADAFALRLNPLGSGAADLAYSTLIGGSSDDAAEAIALAGDVAYLAGETRSTNFPATTGTFQGGLNDGFLAQLDGSGAIQLALFLGGTDGDQARDLALNTLGHVVLTGQTQSADFPVTADSFDPAHNGGRDVFVARLHLEATTPLQYATFLGGDQNDEGYALASDGANRAYLTGYTRSSTFPTTPASFQTTYGGGTRDAFAAKLLVGPSPGLTLRKFTNGQAADYPPGPYVLSGDEVTWSYVVTNTGELDLTGVSVVDDQGLEVSCPSSTLPVLDSLACQGADVALAGQYANTGTATGDPPPGFEVPSAQDTSHYFGVLPGMAFEKLTNGADADVEPGLYLLAGDAITWTYLVTNTSNITMTEIVVTDDQGVAVTCPGDTLSANQAMTCEANGTAAMGQYGNIGTVTGTLPVGPPLTAHDPSHYFGVTTGITLEKLTNGHDADVAPGPSILVGEPVTWTYVVTNAGNTALTGIAVIDDQIGTVTCPTEDLGAGLSMTCTVTGTAALGPYVNLATVTGTPPVGGDITDDDPSHYFGANPSLTIEKATNGVDADTGPGPLIPLGDPVTWTYAVTNTGNVTLTNLSVTDDQGVVVTCPQSVLEPQLGMTCDAGGMAQAGQYANLATVEGLYGSIVVTATDPSHYFGEDPGVDIEKATNGLDADATPGVFVTAGQPITWTYRVTNTGNVDLSDVAVVDSELGAIDCPQTTLVVDAAMECETYGTAIEGQYANTAWVTATVPTGSTVSDWDSSAYYGAAPSLAFEKLTEGWDADAPPGPLLAVETPLTWTYAVTNTGNVTLTGITVTDDQGVDVTCPTSTLASQASMECTASGTAVAGQYANLGSVTAEPPVGQTLTATDPSHYFGVDPSIVVEKATNGEDADTAPGPYVPVGETVTWTYVVTNTGNITLTGITVTDDQGLTVTCPASTLASQASMECSTPGTATAGQYSNVATAAGTPEAGDVVSDTDPSHYFGVETGLAVSKATNGHGAGTPPGPYILVGDPITWTAMVTNTGNITVTDVAVIDDKEGPFACELTALGPGEWTRCTATGTATAGQYQNTVTASANAQVGSTATALASSYYFGADPSLAVTKLTNGLDVAEPPGPLLVAGDPVTWTYAVTNTGNVTLTEVTVVDDQIGAVTCQETSLPVDGETVCREEGLATAGQYENVGTASGRPPGLLALVESSDSSYYFAYAEHPSASLEKWTNGVSADVPPGITVTAGSPVTWTYQVANTGDSELTDVIVTDDSGTPEDPADDVMVCTTAALSSTASMTCTLTGTAVEGAYANTAMVEAIDPWGGVLTDTAVSHYYGAPYVTLTAVDFTYLPLEPLVHVPVTFTATYTPTDATTPITYTWDFGDGVTATASTASVAHTYASDGDQAVQVTAYNAGTPSGVAAEQTVTVECYWADLTCDGRVDVLDLQLAAAAWRCAQEDACYDPRYDVDGDGIVTVIDIMLMAKEWGWSGS